MANLHSSEFQSIEKGETSGKAARRMASLMVSPFSTDWNAELRRLNYGMLYQIFTLTNETEHKYGHKI